MMKIPTRRVAAKPAKRQAQRYTIDMGVTQSILKDFLACRYRSKLQVEGWETKDQRTVFRFGTLFHDTVEHLYGAVRRGLGSDAALATALQRSKLLVEKNLAKAAPSEKHEEIEFEGGVVEVLLPAYVKMWPEDMKREWLAVEGEFKYTFTPQAGGPAYLLRGKRDGVFLDRPKKGPPGVWLLETKTKSQIVEEDLDLTLSFDFQSLFYLLTLEEEYKGPHPILGSLYNVIRKPQLRLKQPGKKNKKAETRQELLARLKEDVAKQPEHYFKRFEIIFPQGVRDEFRAQLGQQLGEFKAWLEGRLPTYRNPNSCLTKYKCAYLEHCASGGYAGYARTRQPFPELAVPVPPDGTR